MIAQEGNGSDTNKEQEMRGETDWSNTLAPPDLRRIRLRVSRGVEAVEKVNLARIRQVQRRCDLSRCSVQDDHILGSGQEAPQNYPLIVVRGFFCKLLMF